MTLAELSDLAQLLLLPGLVYIIGLERKLTALAVELRAHMAHEEFMLKLLTKGDAKSCP